MKTGRKNKARVKPGTDETIMAERGDMEKVAPNNLPFLPPNLSGIVADQTIVIANLAVLGGAFDYVRGSLTRAFNEPRATTPRFAALILSLFVLRLLGLYLKRLPLQARLKRAGAWDWSARITAGVVAMFVAFAPAILIIAFALVPFETESRSYLPGAWSNVFVGGIFMLVALDMLLFAQAAYKPLSADEKLRLARGDWRFSRRAELVADAGLYLYMLAWQGFATMLLASIVPQTGVWLYPIFPLTPVIFCMFYLAPRHLFTLEDFKYRATKLSLLAVYLAPALSALLRR